MNPTFVLSPIGLTLGTVVAWLVLGLAAISFRHRPHLLLRGIFPLTALGGLGLMVAGGWGIHADPSTLVLPLGLPDLPFHLREDALSGFFLFLLGGVIFPVSLFASGYFKSMPAPSLALLVLQYNVFLAGMTLVLVADDAYAFLVAWEVMAIASYFLVTTDHQREECRQAGFIYLLVAHVGAVAILLAFGVLKGHTSGQADYAFAAMRAHMLTPFWTSVAFLLALFGFGAKAGLLPLHVWLPEAHPEAPSPVSALMSGVMLKTAIYGLLRVTFDLLHTPAWWWGALMLALGLLTALFGVMLGAVQTDMKRLLAYSSIENIGVIILVLGLCTIFRAFGLLPLAALALTAALYHSLNHAFFKSLLFLVTGCVLHATGERRLGRLGGLIRRMPWVAGLALVGILAAAGLPPLNGFVSEWLALQAFLLAPGLPEFFLTALIPLAAAALVLASALGAYVMVKFYGIVFLGRHREMALDRAHDAERAERLGMAWLAVGCLLLGLSPTFWVGELDKVTQLLVGAGLGQTAAASGWLWLTPIAAERASYAPLIFLGVVLVAVLIVYVAVRRAFGGRWRRADPWDCGFPAQTARMQDTAEGFGQPIRRIFEPVYDLEITLPTPEDPRPRYSIRVGDRLWRFFYVPVATAAEFCSRQAARLQHGHIGLYLLYSFITLLALLALV